MGNTIKSRLHLRKKGDRPDHNGNSNTAATSSSHAAANDIDEQIMNAPNRARAVETTPSEPVQEPVTLTRGRP